VLVTAAAILALVACLVYVAWHARTVFVIEIGPDGARLRRGRPPPGFVVACTEVARMHGLKRGRIKGLRTGSGIRLRFSADIPERLHQRFRNVWEPPPGGGSGGGARATG